MTRRSTIGTAGLVLLMATATVWAQSGPPPVRVRGTIEKVDGNKLTVKSRTGENMTINLIGDARVSATVKATVADLKPGTYIGVTGMPQPDGSQKAIGIHIFMESQRKVVPSRSGPWDREPGSTMTNATVETTVASNDGQNITVKYTDGEKKVIVAPNTPIVAVAPGNHDDLKPGAVFIVMGGQKQPDGSINTPAIYVGRGGAAPPM